jgi:hypothetical protein
MRVCWPLTEAEVSLGSKSFRGTYGKRNKALFVMEHRTEFRSSELLSLIMDDVLQHERQRIWYHPLSASGGTVYEELGCPSAAQSTVYRQGGTSVIDHKQRAATKHARYREEVWYESVLGEHRVAPGGVGGGIRPGV